MVTPRSTACTPSRARSSTCSRGGAPGLGRGGGEDADRARRRPAPAPAPASPGRRSSGEEPSSTIRASGFGVMPKVRAGRPRRSARRVALSCSLGDRAAEVERRHAEPALGRGDQAARAARLARELDGDVDAGAGVEGLGAVGVVDRGVAEHEARHQVVERVGAEGVAPRAGRGAVGDLALAHPALARRRARAGSGGEVDAVAVVEVAEAEVAEAARLRGRPSPGRGRRPSRRTRRRPGRRRPRRGARCSRRCRSRGAPRPRPSRRRAARAGRA